MKIKFLFGLLYCLMQYHAFAFSDSTVRSKDLRSLIGCWQGSITYLDYTSNKPFSMPANLAVNKFKETNTIIGALSYPKEPKANGPDTIFISEDGKMLNNAAVRSNIKFNNDSTVIVTEKAGIDGNDNKPAIIRHTYNLGKHSYSVKKEVLFIGQQNWILRNEYKFTRSASCP